MIADVTFLRMDMVTEVSRDMTIDNKDPLLRIAARKSREAKGHVHDR